VQPIDGAAQLPVGGVLTFHYPTKDDPCLLVRTGERAYLAYSAECTHLACGIKPEVEARKLHCPCHRGYFELATGVPIAGPPRRPLPRIVLDERVGRLCAVGIERRTV
jgi:Rieske Fe-S protein